MMDYPHQYSTNFDYPSYPTARSSTPSTGYSIDGSYPVPSSYDEYYSGRPQHPQQQQQQPRKYGAHPLHPLQLTTVGAGDVSQEQDDAEYTAHPSRPQPPNPFHGHHQSSLPSDTHVHQPQQRADDDRAEYRREASFESRSGEILSHPGSAGVSGLSRPLNHHEQERIAHLDRLKFFLATAPSRWDANNTDGTSPSDLTENTASASTSSAPAVPASHPTSSHPALNRFLLPSAEYVSCVLWNGLYHITGTDIVRALVFRFEAFGRPVRNMKKFEEGVFSDLRNLKPGVDACLEEPKVWPSCLNFSNRYLISISEPIFGLAVQVPMHSHAEEAEGFLLVRPTRPPKFDSHKLNHLRFSVPHDRLFLDALERDLKREKMGLEPTTAITGEPALSFVYDSKKSLYEQFSKASGGREGEGELEAAVRRADEAAAGIMLQQHQVDGDVFGDEEEMNLIQGSGDEDGLGGYYSASNAYPRQPSQGSTTLPPALRGPNSTFYNMFSLFEGSPTYKQRRKKPLQPASRSGLPGARKSPGSDGEWGSGAEGVMELAAGEGYGPTDSNLNAADMFMKQAKGELGSSSGSKSHRKEDGAHQRHNSYPITSSSAAVHARSAPRYPQHAVSYPSVGLHASSSLPSSSHAMPHALSPVPSISSHHREAQDLHGGEEGLVTAASSAEGYTQPPAYQAQQQHHQMEPSADAYSQWTAPGASRYNLQGSGAAQSQLGHQLRHSESASALYAAPGGSLPDSEYVMPMSAPAHKQMFDHNSLFPPTISLSSSPSTSSTLR